MKRKYSAEPRRSEGFEAAATQVSAVCIAGNLALAMLKAAAGMIAHSGALISDAVHSASDVLVNIIVILGVRMSAEDPDAEHPYGHERFECVAAIVLSVILLITGLFIGLDAVRDLTDPEGAALTEPGMLALAVAAASVAAKELMFRYTWRHAERFGSDALRADAWHHRSDALCGLGVLVGVAGARMGLPKLDAVASLVICGFIAKAACSIFGDAVGKMVDRACSRETEDALRKCAAAQPGVMGIDLLHTREFGSRIYVDMAICVDRRLSLVEGHRISENVHRAVEADFPCVKHIMIQVNPEPPSGAMGEASSPHEPRKG